MSVIVLSDVILANSVISASVRGKSVRLNNRVVTEGGEQQINIIWSQSLREYEIGTVPLRVSDWQALEAIHEITEGGAYGFLLQDPKDHTVIDGALAFDEATDTYQLQKRYVDARSGRYKDRPITRPRSTGFVLMESGVPLSPSAYTLNPDTGRVTIPSLPAASTLSWSGSFYVPVHFKDDAIDWDLVVAGAADQRFLAGPSVVLVEIREYVPILGTGTGTSAPTISPSSIYAPPIVPAPSSPGTPPPAPNPDPIETPVGDVFPSGVGGSWVLTFRDEFDGSSLDSSKWNDEIWYGDNPFGVDGANIPHSEQNYDLSGGALRIWPYRNEDGRLMCRTIDTDGKFYQTYGFFETRMKLPVGPGLWPGFWLFNHDGGPRSELDIMEAFCGDGSDNGWADAGSHPTNYMLTVWNDATVLSGTFKMTDYVDSSDLSSAFHIYGVRWYPNNTVQFYLDGRPIGPVIAFANSRRMYVLLDLWIGSAAGPGDVSTPLGSANALLIDYVRVWQAA